MIRKLLALVSLTALLVGGAVVSASPAAATAPTGQASELFRLTNDSRAAYGRAGLSWDQGLANSAQAYANWMAATNNFLHDVNLNGAVPAAVPGAYTWGENIAWSSGSPNPIPVMHTKYMDSTGHRNNILGTQYDRAGIGIAFGHGKTWSVVRFAASPNTWWLGAPVGDVNDVSSPSINQFRVSGWALDPDTVNSVQIDITVNGALHSSHIANQFRPDVGGVFIGYGNNHGYDLTLSTTGGATKQVCVWARNLAGHGGAVNTGCRDVLVKGNGPYWDLTLTSPFVAEITWLKGSGITSGYEDGTFRPTRTVTRQEMAAFLWRYAGEQSPRPGAPTFTDVPPGSVFATAIRWMAGEGITTGYDDGTFRGNAPLTRQTAAAFLWKLSGEQPVPGGAPNFADVPPGHQFRDPIRWMAHVGVAQGVTPTTFVPSAPLSRQAMAAFLDRYDKI